MYNCRWLRLTRDPAGNWHDWHWESNDPGQKRYYAWIKLCWLVLRFAIHGKRHSSNNTCRCVQATWHLWSRGYDVSLTRWRSPVRSWPLDQFLCEKYISMIHACMITLWFSLVVHRNKNRRPQTPLEIISRGQKQLALMLHRHQELYDLLQQSSILASST